MKPICTFIISNQFFYAFARWSSFMLWQRFLSDVFLWIHILFRSVPVFQISNVALYVFKMFKMFAQFVPSDVCNVFKLLLIICIGVRPVAEYKAGAGDRLPSSLPPTPFHTLEHTNIRAYLTISCSTTQYANIITGNTSNDIRNAIFGTIPIFKWSGQWSVYQHKMMIKTTPETSRLMYICPLWGTQWVHVWTYRCASV